MQDIKKNDLEIFVKELIKKEGSISLERFIELSLYKDEIGYYAKNNPIGSLGDYITAPEISQVFGETLGVWIHNSLLNKKVPYNFILVELGPGKGTLLKDILRTLRVFNKNFSNRVFLIEKSKILTEIQKNNLNSFTDSLEINWVSEFDEIPQSPAIIIANEFFDALPFYQLIYCNNGWYERYIELNKDDDLDFTINMKTNRATPNLFLKENIMKKEGIIFEKSTYGENIANKIANYLSKNKGSSIIIDYGYTKKDFGDTLQALYKHKYCNPLQKIGICDLTHHVDFETLEKVFKEFNLVTSLKTQREFLRSFGIEERTAQIYKKASKENRFFILSGTIRLISPYYMGELFKILTIES